MKARPVGSSRFLRVCLAGVGVLVTATACEADARRDAEAAALSDAFVVKRYLTEHVVVAGRGPAELRTDLRRVLVDPPPEARDSSLWPILHVVADGPAGVTVVFYKNVRGAGPFNASARAWGHACVTYGITAGNEFEMVEVDCPAGLPTKPPAEWGR